LSFTFVVLDSNPSRIIDVCVSSVFVLPVVDRGLATGRCAGQRVVPEPVSKNPEAAVRVIFALARHVSYGETLCLIDILVHA
jgi:hypothetical protein